MNFKQERREMTSYVMLFVGSWYKWAGDDPSGFDCSGAACEWLKSNGFMERKVRLCADDIWAFYCRVNKCQVEYSYEGCFVCYAEAGHDSKKAHIEYCMNSKFSIGASGGGSTCLTIEDAIRMNAFIKKRPIDRSPARIAYYFDPFILLG